MSALKSISYRIRKFVYAHNYSKIIKKSNKPQVLNSEDTLTMIKENHMSIARFGDGEFHLMWNIDLPFQKYCKEIKEELADVLNSCDDNLLVCIPDVFNGLDNYKKKPKKFWEEFIGQHYDQIIALLEESSEYPNIVYGNTNCTRFYSGYENIDYSRIIKLYRSIFENRNIVCIEGEKTRMGVGNDLFDGSASFKRILVPAENAFSKKVDILEYVKNNADSFGEDPLFIIAVGPTATVLAYDLAKIGYQALDLGHLDIQYEYYLAGAKDKINIQGKYVNEAKGGNVVSDDIIDESYLQQIICRV